MQDFKVTIPAAVTSLDLNIMDVLVSIADFLRSTPGFDGSDMQALEELIKRIKRVKGNQSITGSGNYTHKAS